MPPTFLNVRQAGPIIEKPDDQSWDWRLVARDEDLILESWSQGFVVGGLLLMMCITVANMRRNVLLHKLIFLEQAMALTHGTFCFLNFDGYGWYLSSTAALLYMSYILHNVVAWLKVKPFFHGKSTIFEPKFVKWTTRIYTCSLAATVPPVLFQITDNFRFFNGYGGWYRAVRPYEPLMRDPWWVFCCAVLFYVVSKSYGMGVFTIIKKSPRFGILFVSIILALIFTSLDIVASVHPFIGSTDGINPFWKLSLVFKCLTDAILLDDFKTELKRLGLKRVKRDEKRRDSHALVLEDDWRLDSDDEAAAHYSNGTINSQSLIHAHRPSVIHTRQKNSNQQESEEVEFMQALNTHPSQLSSDRESRRSSATRPQIGRGGTPATRLPRLFQAIKPGKRSKKVKDEEEATDRNASIWMTTKPRNGSDKENYEEENDNGNNRHHLNNEDGDHHALSNLFKTKKVKRAETDNIAPDEIRHEDDALAEARRLNENTIAELTKRKNSAVTTNNQSRKASSLMGMDSNNSPGQILQQDKPQPQEKKRSTSRGFWDGIDELDECHYSQSPVQWDGKWHSRDEDLPDLRRNS